MGYILDIILVVIIIVSVVYGAKKGFFKSLTSLLSGIASLFVAYTFTPPLSNYIKDTFILDKVAKSLAKTFASIAESGTGSSESAAYDLTALFEDSQFADVVKRAGLSVQYFAETFTDNTYDAVETCAYAVAEPLSKAVSEILAFSILFVVAFVVFKVLTSVVGLLFKLPILKDIDKNLGVIFGALCALFFVWVFAMSADSLFGALSAIAPSSFGSDITDNSILLGFFAKFNPISAITAFLATKA